MKCGVYLWDGVIVEDDCFIGPNTTFTNDRVPRSKVYPEQYSKTVLRKGSSIGANSTILPGIEIGGFALVGAGSVVTHNVPDYALVYGNPARQTGWVCSCARKLNFVGQIAKCCDVEYRLLDGVLEVNHAA